MKIARASAFLSLTYVVSTLTLQVTPAAWGQSAAGDPHSAPLPKEKPSAPAHASSYGKLPLSFEANQGQTDSRVRFLSRGQGCSLFLTNSAAVLILARPNPHPNNSANALAAKANPTKARQSDVVRMELAGANPAARVTGADQLPGIANYFLGKDPSSWHTNVPTYAKVKYSSVYPGVDLVYYGNQRQLEYDFLVSPGADPKQVRYRFAGAKRLSLKPNGDLTVTARYGEVAFHKPAVYQTVNGQRHSIEGRFALLARNKVGFQLGNYDHTQELVIDPVLSYSTYLGGSMYDNANGIAIDSSENAYVVGNVAGDDFPVTQGALQTSNPIPILFGSLGFISKLNPTGSGLTYSTYFGGGSISTTTNITAVAIDGAGDAFVTGNTTSTDLPTSSGAFQPLYPAGTESQLGFVAKLNPSGSALVYSSYLGGSDGTASGAALTVDSEGNAYVAGSTTSTTFPVTQGSFQAVNPAADPASSQVGFVAKVNPSGSALAYSTYLGGSLYTAADAIAVDPSGNAYVTGQAPVDFPVTSGAFNISSGGAFVSKLNSNGSALIYSTFLGKDGFVGSGIAVDRLGDAYVTGSAYDSYPVTPGAFETTYPAGSPGCGFVTKLNPKGSGQVYSTFLGGSGAGGAGESGDIPLAIAIDDAGEAYVTGLTESFNFPVTSNALQTTNPKAQLSNPNDIAYPSSGFFTKFNSAGSLILYSTYLGGDDFTQDVDLAGGDEGEAIAVDSSGNAFIAGGTNSDVFPTTAGAFQTTNPGENPGPGSNYRAYVAWITKFTSLQQIGTTIDLTSTQPDGAPLGQLLSFVVAVNSASPVGLPSGDVVFSVDGIAQETVPLLADAHAVYYNSRLSAGSHHITAAYQGSAVYAASSQSLTQTIDNTAVQPVILPPSGTYRTVQAVISTVTPNAAIYYTTDGTAPNADSKPYTGPIPINISGVIRAVAIPKGGMTSTPTTSIYVLQPLAVGTTTSIQASAAQLPSGRPVTFNVTVTPASPAKVPGDVLFMDGPRVMGSVPLQFGRATFTTSALAVGGHSITAFYPGVPENPAIPYPGSAASQSPAVVVGVGP